MIGKLDDSLINKSIYKMNFKLRPFREDDLDQLVLLGNNFEIAKNLTDKFPHPYTKNNGEFFINLQMSQTPAQVKVIEIDGKFAGAVGLHFHEDVRRKSLEIGYWLGEPHWGNGIMPQAVKQMIKYSFETFDANRIFARIFGENNGSRRVLEKVGFRKEGHCKDAVFKNGAFQDELIFAILKKDFLNSIK